MKISGRITRMAPSATATMADRAKALKAQGVDVISFTTGEPDFDSPKSALDAAVKAMKEGQTHYTATPGIMELRKAVSGYYKMHFGLDYDPKSEIICATGAKQTLYEAVGCLVNPGDEVIIFAPAWVSYVEQIRIFDGKPVIIDTSKTGFLPDPAQFEAAITPRTVAVMINNPCNPTGMVWPAETLKAIAEICVKHGIVLINDEIYGRLVYDMPVQKHVLELVPEARDVTLNINGVSKSYAMTGWRLGYALGPAPLIKAMNSMQGHLTSGTCSITQWAATGAIENAEADIERMRVQFDKRRHLICGLLDDIRGLTYVKPQGAFYTFINVSAYLGEKTGMADDIAFCERVLAEKALALVPGTAFLCPGWVRISYSCNEETIKAGIARLKEFVESL